jgi:uracil-DNA glycosylase
MHVLFVGDRPSSKNLDTKVAFVGTKSHAKLLSWIKALGPDVTYDTVNSTDEDLLRYLEVTGILKSYIVTLGNNADKAVKKLLLTHGIAYEKLYKMPHPSGRNRLLNDKAYETRCLEGLKEALWVK